MHAAATCVDFQSASQLGYLFAHLHLLSSDFFSSLSFFLLLFSSPHLWVSDMVFLGNFIFGSCLKMCQKILQHIGNQ